MLPSYKVLTVVSVLDIPYEDEKQHEQALDDLILEQDRIVKENGIDYSKNHKVHFFNSAYTTDAIRDMDIDYAIQCLAIKDGVDLVRFGNGNLGYVAYYNGRENGFEILCQSKGEQEDE